ncbi:MAG: NAD-dependent epimerase/dehydratase family protein [Pseudonocardiaceae bacterium]|nr:NAD-dependent epimerase/dehydratase family protein [Pseudonocardiaceae bacterium]
MRIAVLGGTEFIGRRIVHELAARGDEVLVIHRGRHEPDGESPSRHLHVDRQAFATVAEQVHAFQPDAFVDTRALSLADVRAVLPHLPDCQLITLSSMDVYRAYERLHAGGESEPLPLHEGSRLREHRHPYRGKIPGLEDYEKLEVEPEVLARGGTVLRLGMVYGEHDTQRREEFVLRRVRAGRERIPVGPGNWLWTRVYVGDVAGAVLATLGSSAVAGEVFNIGEPETRGFGGWVRQILAAAGHHAELVEVPEELLPEDLVFTKAMRQHMLVCSAKARRLLGWCCADPDDSLARSVAWHLRHAPEDGTDDFSADDRALAVAGR